MRQYRQQTLRRVGKTSTRPQYHSRRNRAIVQTRGRHFPQAHVLPCDGPLHSSGGGRSSLALDGGLHRSARNESSAMCFVGL
ncbi:Hypothetical protein, putative [Bodo saltans]|uniref:Uncharacterized protein n=1 Tax=Bodo saltans TaxID=75058 RepID=A0A0S4JCL0_BODSA|nr:Hypothetical protein, putative [Bodo saltans]|eukprot:CUG87964.1 Hypothetical protein, putative [Bodo saltans]